MINTAQIGFVFWVVGFMSMLPNEGRFWLGLFLFVLGWMICVGQ